MGEACKWIGFERVVWIYLALDGNQWRALLNTVMSPPFTQKTKDFFDYLSDY
jgi:hypothetical protein